MRITTLIAHGLNKDRENFLVPEDIKDELAAYMDLRPRGWYFHPHKSCLGWFIIGSVDPTEAAEGWEHIRAEAQMAGLDFPHAIRILGTWFAAQPELKSVRENVELPDTWVPGYIQQDDHSWFITYDVGTEAYSHLDWARIHYDIRMAMANAEGILA